MEIQEVKNHINKPVLYKTDRNRIEYILSACILRTYNNKFYYQAELKDKNNNSVIIVPLEKVEASI